MGTRALKPTFFLTFERKGYKLDYKTFEKGKTEHDTITLQFKTYPSLYEIEKALEARMKVYFVHSEWFLTKAETVEAS